MKPAMQVFAFIALTLLATGLLVAAGLNEDNARPATHSGALQSRGGHG